MPSELMLQPVALTECHIIDTGVSATTLKSPFVPLNEKSVMVGAIVVVVVVVFACGATVTFTYL